METTSHNRPQLRLASALIGLVCFAAPLPAVASNGIVILPSAPIEHEQQSHIRIDGYGSGRIESYTRVPGYPGYYPSGDDYYYHDYYGRVVPAPQASGGYAAPRAPRYDDGVGRGFGARRRDGGHRFYADPSQNLPAVGNDNGWQRLDSSRTRQRAIQPAQRAIQPARRAIEP